VIAHLFIVSRLEPDLFTYLSREFAQEDDVRVIVDRRATQRRRSREGFGTTDLERRRRDRRAQAHVARQISSLGYAFVRLDT
jgi:hypothetical protein